MPVILNIATNMLFSAALVLTLRRSRALRLEVLSWQLLALTAFEALIFTPVATYLFRFYPQWSMLYFFDPQLYPDLDRWIGLLSLLAILCNFAALVGGFAVARLGIMRHKAWIWAIPFVLGAGTWLAVLVVFGDRVLFIGDFDGFWQGSASMLLKNLPGWLGVSLHVATATFVVLVGRRFAHRDPSLL